MQKLAQILGVVRETARNLGPYLVLELILPGGTLFAITLFWLRRRATKKRPDRWPGIVPLRSLAGSVE